MAKALTKPATSTKAARSEKSSPGKVVYLLGKGTSRLLNARVNQEEIHLMVNGPAMLYGSARLLTSLDLKDGATYQAWKQLARALKCTSHCGYNGKTVIPVEVDASRIGTCLTFSLGPMSMYQSLVVLRPKQKGKTMREVLDEVFGAHKSYTALIIPEPATGHAEHDATIFDTPPQAGSTDETTEHHH